MGAPLQLIVRTSSCVQIARHDAGLTRPLIANLLTRHGYKLKLRFSSDTGYGSCET